MEKGEVKLKPTPGMHKILGLPCCASDSHMFLEGNGYLYRMVGLA